MNRTEACELCAKLNDLTEKHERARSSGRLNDLTIEINAVVYRLQTAGHPVEHPYVNSRFWQLVPTEEERTAAREALAEYQKPILLGELAAKRRELSRRIGSARSDLDMLDEIVKSERTDFWPLTSSNWADMQKLAVEITLLQKTLVQLGVFVPQDER